MQQASACALFNTWDAAGGKLLMEISRFNTEFLYQVSLPTGVGSNPIGLDRGQLGGTHVVFFERIGPKVLLVQPNYRYRAISSDAAERRAVEESFARSVLWGFKVEAADCDRVLVDATAVATESLRELKASLKLAGPLGASAAHRRATQEDIERFLVRPDAMRKQTVPLPTPAGDPIGSKSQSR